MSLPISPLLLRILAHPAVAALPATGPGLLLLALFLGVCAAVTSDKSTDKVSGEDIKKLRTRKHWTQDELASYLGVGVATIRRWESGAVTPTGNNHALLAHLLATSDDQNLVQVEKESLDPWEKMLKMLLADGRAKRILASRTLSLDLSGAELSQNPLPQLVELLQGGTSTGQTELALPFPKTSAERAVASQEDLQGTVDSVLLEMFNQEREARGLTASKMLETILWKYFNYPALSFQPQVPDAIADGPVCAIEQISTDNYREA